MLLLWRPARGRAVAVALMCAVGLTACGGDDDASPGDAAEQPEAGDDAAFGDDLLVGDPSDLVVPLDYLQGEWCNTDGEAWSIEGETARFGASHAELYGEMPVALAFGSASQQVVISQTDDVFVLDLQTREVTFTRGRC